VDQQKKQSPIAYTYGDIDYQLPIKLKQITQLKIVQTLNEHAKIMIKGIAPDTLEPQDIEQVNEKAKIQISLPGRTAPYFVGVCTNIQMNQQAGLKTIEIEGLSWTYELDIQKQSRSYQKLDISYHELIGAVLKEYPQAGFITALPEDKKYTTFAVQYRETNWEFLKRIAAREGTVLVPEYADSEHRPRFWLGLPKLEPKQLAVTAEKGTCCDHSKYQKMAANHDASLREKDFLTYETTSHEILPLGQTVEYDDKQLSVIQVISEINKGLLTSTYTLAFSEKMTVAQPENENLKGLSLPGKVLNSSGVNSKIHLDIDDSQEEDTAIWFPYASDSGNTLYCMPQNGETINLYFKDGYEDNAIAVNGARKNGGGCKKTADYNNRYFTNSERKEMFLSPDTVAFTADESAAEKIAITMTDQDGITIESTKPIVFDAQLGINIEAEKNISIEATQGLYIYSGTSSIVIKDNNVNFYGTKVVVEGTKKAACPDVEQPPDAKEDTLTDSFMKMPLIEKVQLGLDIASCCPVIGSVTSIISGGISVAQGNFAAAALDFACVIPGVGFIKAGVKAERLGKAVVKALKVEKALNKVAKAVEVTGEVLGKGKTLALKVVEKIPKIHVEEVYVGGLRTAEGVEVGGFRYFAVKVGEKEGGKVAERAGQVPKGGAYKDVPANGGEVHHMPADSVSPLSKGKGPGVRMEKPDHMKTKSWGSSKKAKAYRAKQEELIKEGKFDEAQQMDIDDVQSKFGDKYDEGIKQMKDYTEKILK